MKNWKIKMTETLHMKLTFHLFSDSTMENGCFLKVNSKGNLMFIKDVILPNDIDWLTRGTDICIPNSKYINQALNEAEKDGCSLAFVHTHPLEFHPASFSELDIRSNKKMFENIYPLIELPIASFVLTKSTMHGIVYSKNSLMTIDSFHIHGKNYKKVPNYTSSKSHLDEEMYDRQIGFIGKANQLSLKDLSLTVVGAGGIGSPLALQLAKIGVGEINVIDGDKIDTSNLPRIYGASESDIGRYKVDVLKEFIEKQCQIKVNIFPEFIDSTQHYALINSDIIFGGLDNHTARDLLNTISIEYSIPYIDSGCAIPMNERGEIEAAPVMVSVVHENGPCLWCMKTLNGNRITEENLDEEEKKQREEDGYLLGIKHAPSVIFQTTNVASLAVNRLFHLLNIFNSEYSEKTVFDMYSGERVDYKVERNPKCPFHNNPYQ